MNEKTMHFVIFCVGNVADALHISERETYNRMMRSGIIYSYIVPCYDVLHTFSREHIVEDLMRKKEVAA